MEDTHPWIPSFNREDHETMLKSIGVTSVDELFSDIPQDLRLKRPLNVGYGRGLSEWELMRIVERKLARIKPYIDPPPFLGGGICYHVVPSVVKYVISRGEFYTAYTPYQPEINQGLLQALFEYQSLVAELLEMDVVNASMYDGSTAAAEAVLMALRVTRRKRILVASNIHPEKIDVIKTWLLGKDVEVITVDYNQDTGLISLEDFDKKSVVGDIAGIYVDQISFFGTIERNLEYLSDKIHRKGGLFIVGFEPLSLGILRPPGLYDADIAVGEGQPLGLGLNYGGSTLGILAVKGERKLVRQMPGRLIGLTRTVSGERSFTMILQTREQHIRREKATSNITTNSALMALAAAVYLSLLGSRGLREIAETIWLHSHYASRRLNSLYGVESPYFTAEFFKEFVARFPKPYKELYFKAARKGVLAGTPLEFFSKKYANDGLFCVTEAHSMSDIDRLVDVLGDALGDRE